MKSTQQQNFTEILQNKEILAYLASVKIETATNIQSRSIPQILKTGDTLIQGKTGSGKTFCFLLPLIVKLKELEEQNLVLKKGEPRAVILAPTRELAMQVFRLAKEISHFAKLRVRKLIGGDKGRPLAGLFTAQIDLLIATPDRLLRALNNKELRLHSMQLFVLDEADQLLEPSFKKTMIDLTRKIDQKQTQVTLCSATRPNDYADTIQEFFPSKKFNTIGKGEENKFGHSVETFNITLEEEDKLHFLKQFIKKQGKSNGIIFVGNKFRAQKAFDALVETGLAKAYLIHKGVEIKARAETMQKFSASGGSIIATDVMARGIDIPHLHWVLNFDLPTDAEYYLHRSGRVGRAGRPGTVFNFVTSKDEERQLNINRVLMGQDRQDLKLPSLKNINLKKKNPAKLQKKRR